MRPNTAQFVSALTLGALTLALWAQQSAHGLPTMTEESTAKQATPHVVHENAVRAMPSEELIQADNKRYAAELSGASLFKAGKTNDAIAAFQEALTYDANDITALRGLVKCYAKLGDTPRMLEAIHKALYFNDPTQQVIRETDSTNLMLFASLLDKAGKTREAVTVYNEGASILKYIDDKPGVGYLMPLIGTAPGQITYASNRLQAMTQVGMELDQLYAQDFKPAERLAHLREAAKLYPDSPVVYAYLSDKLEEMYDTAGAKAAMNRANGLGYQGVVSLLDAQTAEMQVQKAQAAGK